MNAPDKTKRTPLPLVEFDDEDFWSDLIGYIKVGRVLPIVGQGITTIEEGNALLGPWLAEKLSARLDIDFDLLPNGSLLNDVVCHHLISGTVNDGIRQPIYTRLHRILRDESPLPGKTLHQLASIDPLNCFISTTFDPLLSNALAEARSEEVQVFSYSPTSEEKDLPNRIQKLSKPTVFHLLGKSSSAGAGKFVVWEDDMMEFILGLNKHLNIDCMPNLSQDLKDPNFHYLALGLSFSDWLVRFFLSAARQNPFFHGNRMVDYLVDQIDHDSNSSNANGMVMYFKSVDRRLQVIACDPREFVNELAQRWHKEEEQEHDHVLSKPPINKATSKTTGKKTVFVSYARKDEQAARNFKNGLDSDHIEVLMDKFDLHTGMHYPTELREMIDQCDYFVSLISSTTESKIEAYFHKERNWAANRAEAFTQPGLAKFYHPVVIDDISLEEVKQEPRIFAEAQRTTLIDGEVADTFKKRFEDLANGD